MDSASLSGSLTQQISAGGKVAFIDTFAHHSVIVVVRSGKLMIFLHRGAEARSNIIGVGVKLMSEAGITNTVPVTDAVHEQFSGPAPQHVIPIGTYRGPVALSLCTSDSDRNITFVL